MSFEMIYFDFIKCREYAFCNTYGAAIWLAVAWGHALAPGWDIGYRDIQCHRAPTGRGICMMMRGSD